MYHMVDELKDKEQTPKPSEHPAQMFILVHTSTIQLIIQLSKSRDTLSIRWTMSFKVWYAHSVEYSGPKKK